jgi:serine/threonine protein phosphatase PrpC
VTTIGELSAEHTVGGIRLSWSARTDVGRRRAANEDSMLAQPPLFVVADGMGGHAAGDLASAAVVSALAEAAPTGNLDRRGLESALQQATDRIDELADGSELGVGTTVTGVVLSSADTAELTVFNIGDSRVYVARPGDELQRLTVDHSVVQELVEAGVLDPDEAEFHPDSNVITRAVGFGAVPEPDYWTFPAEAGMTLLVCSDGLTKELRDARISELALDGTPSEAVEALVDAALASGGHDNISVIVVRVSAA